MGQMEAQEHQALMDQMDQAELLEPQGQADLMDHLVRQV